MKNSLLTALAVVLFGTIASAQNLTVLVDDSELSTSNINALIAAYTAQHPNVSFNVELRPGGTEGDNIVKTRLATGDMSDIFVYNSGSLLQALNPSRTLTDLSGQPFMNNVVESFIPVVTQGNGVYGVPFGTGMGGGILYNKAVYKKLGLKIPLTWDDFVANNAAVAKAGLIPVVGSFADSWTAQLFVLADNYNVAQKVPNFAELYTAHKIDLATNQAALAGYEHLQQGHELSWWQNDAATTKYNDALKMLATGEAAHYPMLTFALPQIAANFPDNVNDIGFFAQPSDSPDINGVTFWMPGAAYIPNTTTGEKLNVALDFLGFIASVQGTNILTESAPPNGPYLIKGATLPGDVLPAVSDLAAYIDSGHSYPALEFLSPVKGPNLEQIAVAVATGQMTAVQGAQNYAVDIERQAQQLGLPGW